jgi:hypothetical protein
MVLLAEMVRLLSDESNLVNVATAYNVTSATYATIHDYENVVLTKAGLLLIAFDGSLGSAGNGYIRVRIGASLYSFACKQAGAAGVHYTFMVYLAAGTYDVLVEGCVPAGGISIIVDDFQAGFVNFSDLTGEALVAYTGAIAKTTAARNTPLGVIKNTVYCVTVYAITAGAQTNMENPGNTLTNGVQILIDGVQQSWTERWQGDANGMAAGGKLYKSASAGVSHSITVTTDNGATAVNVSVAVCPWILTNALSEIVSLDFPRGSTVYVTEEPLDGNPTKYIYIGKIRGVTFGAATDYYSSASATGISAFSYTFEFVNVSQCLLQVYGFGGCISSIAVDLR